MICLASMSVASTYTVTLASDPACQATAGKRVHGSTGWHDGDRRVAVNGQAVREYCGWKTYDWDRTNLTSAVDFEPDSGLVSHFYTPATVLWGTDPCPVPVDPPMPVGQ